MTKILRKMSIVVLSVGLFVSLSASSPDASAPANDRAVEAPGSSSGDCPPAQKSGVELAPGTGSTMSPAAESQESAASPGGAYADKILWFPPETGASGALFIPESVLKSTPFEELPLGASRRPLNQVLGGWEAFKREVQETRGVTPERCNYALGGAPDGSMPEASSLDDQIFRENRVSFLGTVVATVLGLDVPLRRVRTMVYVRVDELFFDARAEALPGDVFAFQISTGGRIELDSGPLCTTPPLYVREFLPGDELLISADYNNHFDRYVSWEIIGRIKNGVVQLDHNAMLTDTQPLGLETLRERLETKALRRPQ